jgi:hypothetical protein
VNCCVPAALAVTVAGVIASDCNVPVPTVSVVVPVTPEAEAEMVTEPLFFPCAIPEPRIEAMLGLDDFQLNPARLLPTLPSLKVPVAVNLIEVRTAILGFAGLMLIETKCAVDTVSPVEPLIEPKAAWMVVLPVAKLVTRPWLLTVAAEGFEEVQTAEAETSCVLLSLNVPVAVNCLVVPTAMVELAGVTAIETKLAPVTVSEAVPLTELDVAVIVAVPVPTPVAMPVLSIVATVVEEDVQVTDGSSCVLPSSKFPTALNC